MERDVNISEEVLYKTILSSVKICNKVCEYPVEGEKISGSQLSSEQTYCAFYSGNDNSVLSCEVGGVKLDLLIDSVSDANLIPDTVWDNLKQAKRSPLRDVLGSSRAMSVTYYWPSWEHLLQMSRWEIDRYRQNFMWYKVANDLW